MDGRFQRDEREQVVRFILQLDTPVAVEAIDAEATVKRFLLPTLWSSKTRPPPAVNKKI